MCPVDFGLLHAVEEGSPFHATLGAKVVSIERGHVTLRLDAPEGLRNHLGGPHAAALFGLAEVAAAAVALSLFDDLVLHGCVPVVKGARIDYRRVALGVVTASASFAGDEQAVRREVEQRGKAVFPVEVSVQDGEAVVTTLMTADMALKRVTDAPGP